MKKTAIFWLLGVATVMLLLPALTLSLPAEAGMAALILLFFIVDTFCLLATGIFAGWDLRSRWWFPIGAAVLYLCGVWLFVDVFEMDFLLYAAGYLAVGLLSMGATALIWSKAGKGR